MSKLISREDLQLRMAANLHLVLLEALPEKYYNDGHLPGALHMPHDQTTRLAPTLIKQRDSETVVYCASKTCQNSHIAANFLAQAGYTNVAVYAGGKEDWADAGLALIKEAVTV